MVKLYKRRLRLQSTILESIVDLKMCSTSIYSHGNKCIVSSMGMLVLLQWRIHWGGGRGVVAPTPLCPILKKLMEALTSD